MTKSPPATTLEHLGARLHEQALEVAILRLALDIQLRRIAAMRAELDPPPQGSRHVALPTQARSACGDGRSGLARRSAPPHAPAPRQP